MFSNLRKTSATINGNISSKYIDLDVMYEYLNISDKIEKIKYNGRCKTKSGEGECSTFNNQVSIKMVNGVDIKIFSSSTFSISGAGNVDIAIEKSTETLNYILSLIKMIKKTKSIKCKKNKGFNTYYNNRIVTKNKEGVYICSNNSIKSKKIILNCNDVEEFDLLPGMFIDIKHKNKIKHIYNNLAVCVGYVEYKMIRNNKSLCVKGCKYIQISENKFEILNQYSNKLGVLEMSIYDGHSQYPEYLPEELEIYLFVCDPDTKISDIKFSNCNYNIKLLNCDAIDRNSICKELENLNVCYTYNPSSYPGIKFSINEAKVTIFRTGSVLFSSKVSIELAYQFILNLFKNDFKIKEYEDIPGDEDLTIWDI